MKPYFLPSPIKERKEPDQQHTPSIVVRSKHTEIMAVTSMVHSNYGLIADILGRRMDPTVPPSLFWFLSCLVICSSGKEMKTFFKT